MATLYGKEISIVNPANPISLTPQQKMNIRQLSYYQHLKGETYSPDDIYRLWPTDPSEEWRAGKRPSVTAITQFKRTDEYRKLMLEVGIEVYDVSELTQEQISAISLLTNYSDPRSPRMKLKSLGIPWVRYTAWMKQQAFNEAIRSVAGKALEESIPLAEVKIAEKAAEGDIKYIKFLFEITGRHNPAQQQLVDVQALMNVMIDAAQEVFGKADPALYQEFINTVRLRANTVKGVQA